MMNVKIVKMLEQALGLLTQYTAAAPRFVVSNDLAVYRMDDCDEYHAVLMTRVVDPRFSLSYNIFRIPNMKTLNKAQKISAVLEEIAHPARLAILLSIGNEEACVCHLEALLGKRQAYISQHLMAMRDAGILLTRREGKFIFYRLRDPMFLKLIELAAKMENVDISDVPTSAACTCPNCIPKHEEKLAYSPG